MWVRALLIAGFLLLPGLAAAAEQPPLVNEAVIDAPVSEVWKAFTTKEGLESWNVAHAEVDLRVGGLMRTHYSKDGVLGDAGTIENTILAFDPERMFAIRATKTPATFPFKKAMERVWTVVYFEPVGAQRTRVVARGLGYGTDEESQKMREFFDQGNSYLFEKLKMRFARK
ncbi:MAG TPA: SRPBCC domain-containing protein [Armatimonadota bacterium]|nr:SRPBCC domain-containing protein [Armatimonadota bacterium]